MSVLTHLTTLEEKHAKLEKLIKEEYARPLPDLSLIKKMKKQKLVLKEEITQLYATLEDKKRAS